MFSFLFGVWKLHSLPSGFSATFVIACAFSFLVCVLVFFLQLLDHNVQQIVDCGFTVEQAEYSLRQNRNNVERALRSLQVRDISLHTCGKHLSYVCVWIVLVSEYLNAEERNSNLAGFVVVRSEGNSFYDRLTLRNGKNGVVIVVNWRSCEWDIISFIPPPFVSGIDHHLLQHFVLHSLCGVLICDLISFKFTCVCGCKMVKWNTVLNKHYFCIIAL